MNERIKELGKQAMSATFNKFSGVEWSAEEWRNFYDTKFAELIVEECRNVVSEVYRNTPLELCGPLLTADEAIAKHFYGVEK